jgi:transcriptional regulator with XRE-family HTH domain
MTKTPPLQRFGEKLRTLRQRHGMTMQGLAAQLSTSSGYISMLENGQREPRAAFVFKVARLFQVSADALLDDELEV